MFIISPKRCLGLFLLYLFTCGVVSGQPVNYIGIEQGLSNNAVTSIYQDARGFMWFGTYDGLNRYDGYGFKVYRNVIGDTASLCSNSIYTTTGDDEDHVWVGTQNGVSIFDQGSGRFKQLSYINSLGRRMASVQDNIRIIEAVGGMMLVGTQHNCLIVTDKGGGPGRQVASPVPGFGDVTAIGEDPMTHRIWVFIQQVGLCAYDPKERSLRVVSSLITQAYCLRVTRDRSVWIGNDGGCFRLDPEQGKMWPSVLPPTGKVVDLCEDRQGRLWIASDGGGVWVKAPGDEKAVPFRQGPGLPAISSNAVYAVYEDQDGRKWIGTLRGGINMISPAQEPFKKVTLASSVPANPADNFVLSFCADDRDNLWIGTDGAGLRYWDRHEGKFTEYRSDPANPRTIGSNFITSLIKDEDGDLWASTWFGGIGRFQPSTRSFRRYTCYNPERNVVENNVWVMYEDRGHTIWASTTNDGSLYYFDKGRDRFELLDNRLQNLQCIYEDKAGGFWGGNYSSLIAIDRAQLRHRTYDIGFPVRCIHEDSRGRFWVGTQDGGLLLMDRATGKYIRYTSSASGLPSNTILRILEDRSGYLWISTFNGLCRFDPVSGFCRTFSSSDGLQSSQFSFNAALALRTGEFVFGGIRGFNIFFPDSIRDQTAAPKLYLNGLRVGNKEVGTGWGDDNKGLRLPFDQGTVSIDFLALAYAGSDKISYAYRLDGWDKSWNYVGNIRTAYYSQLQEGSYTFKVKALNAGGRWSDAVSLLHITVLPPWYRSWWAYLIYGLSLCGLVLVYVEYTRYKERLKYEIRLAHLENEKEREIAERRLSFFTHISHEFRTPLTLIINPLKQWVEGNPASAESGGLMTVYRNARRLLSLVDQLLLFRKADVDMDALSITRVDIAGVCREVYALFLQQARSRQMDYRLEAPAAALWIHADLEKVEIVLFNLLSNAFKFTPQGGTVVIHLDQEGDTVRIVVRDSGCGIDEQERPFVFDKFRQGIQGGRRQPGFGIGLFLVKHFVEAHKGAVGLSSTPGQGTSITLLLPVNAGPATFEPPAANEHVLLKELAADIEQEPATKTRTTARPAEGKSPSELLTEKRSILIIDDDQDIRDYLRRAFTDQFLILDAASAEEGWTLAENQLPDLIISDVQMQGMDGIALCNRIKQSDTLGHIPVILLTAMTSPDMKLKGLEEGADDYITKPFDIHLLHAKVESVLRNRHVLQRYFFDSITLRESAVRVPAEYRNFLAKCIQVVEENIDVDDFNIKKFSQAMGMSHRALYHKIKSVSGQSAVAFIRSIRLRRAAVLMLREDLNISQAAFQVGMGDVKYFREQFSRTFGMTPSEYIKKYRSLFNRDLTVIPTPEGGEM